MQRRIVGGVVGILLAAMLVAGILDSLVWMPLELAPGIPLDRIYAALDRSGDLIPCVAAPILWFLFWGACGVVYLLVLLHPAFVVTVRPITVAALGAALLGGTGFFHWWSAFAMGNSVSDELPPYTGGTTDVGMTIVLGGLLLILAAGVLAVVVRATRVRTVPEPI